MIDSKTENVHGGLLFEKLKSTEITWQLTKTEQNNWWCQWITVEVHTQCTPSSGHLLVSGAWVVHFERVWVGCMCFWVEPWGVWLLLIYIFVLVGTVNVISRTGLTWRLCRKWLNVWTYSSLNKTSTQIVSPNIEHIGEKKMGVCSNTECPTWQCPSKWTALTYILLLMVSDS